MILEGSISFSFSPLLSPTHKKTAIPARRVRISTEYDNEGNLWNILHPNQSTEEHLQANLDNVPPLERAKTPNAFASPQTKSSALPVLSNPTEPAFLKFKPPQVPSSTIIRPVRSFDAEADVNALRKCENMQSELYRMQQQLLERMGVQEKVILELEFQLERKKGISFLCVCLKCVNIIAYRERSYKHEPS